MSYTRKNHIICNLSDLNIRSLYDDDIDDVNRCLGNLIVYANLKHSYAVTRLLWTLIRLLLLPIAQKRLWEHISSHLQMVCVIFDDT